MLEPTEGYSYIISTSSNNSCIIRSDIVKACEEWVNGIVEKKC